MLDIDVTEKITESIGAAGVGSPFVFTPTQDNTVETLTGYKVTADGVTTTQTIRRTEFVGNKLVITLATFTPTVTVTGQASLAWDAPATAFTVTVDNPTVDYPDQWLSIVDSVVATTGEMTALSTFTRSDTRPLPLEAAADFTSTFTVDGDSYIRPTHASVSGGASGGTVAATVTLLNDTATGAPATWGTTYPLATSWQSVSHAITTPTLSGSTFLKTYPSTTINFSVSGVGTQSNAVCTLTPTAGGALSNPITGQTSAALARTATFTFLTPICKDNTTTARTVSLGTVFTRPSTVTGILYTHTPTPVATNNPNVTFTYPSFTTWTNSGSTAPSAATLINDATANGFVSDSSVIPHMLGNEASSLTFQVVNNSEGTRVFWFCVKGTHTTKPTIVTSTDGNLLSTKKPEDIFSQTFTLAPTASPTGWGSAVTYQAWGITLNSGPLYVSVTGAV